MQIGPRIRVGGTLGKIGESIRKPVGRALQVAAPFASFIPGVGPLAAAGLGALGGAVGGKIAGDSDKHALMAGAAGAAGGYGVGKGFAGGLGGFDGMAKAGGGLMGKVGSGVKAVGKAALGGMGGGGEGQGGGGFGMDDLIPLLLGGGAAWQGVTANNEANALRERAMGMAEQDYAGRGQFRTAAAPMLLNQQRPDLSATFGGYTNPYTKKLPAVGGGAR